jgi:arylsulfatase A-like enzyme
MPYNVILITLDALRPDKLHFLQKFMRIIKQGTLFSTSITASPYTLASMHAMLSGIYPHYNGVNGYLRVFRFKKESIQTLPQYFKEQGYATRADLVNTSLVPNQGFDQVTSYGEKENVLERHKQILTEITSQNSPFFVHFHQALLHSNLIKDVLQVYQHDDENYYAQQEDNERRYESYLVDIDRYASELFYHIKELGLMNNSIIVFHSDHGASFGERFGERIYGEYLYEETIRAFTLFIQPKIFPPKEITSTVSLIDIMPTLMDLLNITPNFNKLPIQGKTLIPFTKEEETGGRIAFSEAGGMSGPYPSPKKHNLFSVRNDSWKLIYQKTVDEYELYDLINDPEERDNLIGTNQEIEQSLKKLIIV